MPAGRRCRCDDVVSFSRVADRLTGYGDWVSDTIARLGREDVHARPLAHDLELLDGVRALEVRGDQKRLVALTAQPAGELAGQARLTRPLEAGEHDHSRRGLGEAQAAGLAAEDPISSSLTILMTC